MKGKVVIKVTFNNKNNLSTSPNNMIGRENSVIKYGKRWGGNLWKVFCCIPSQRCDVRGERGFFVCFEVLRLLSLLPTASYTLNLDD